MLEQRIGSTLEVIHKKNRQEMLTKQQAEERKRQQDIENMTRANQHSEKVNKAKTDLRLRIDMTLKQRRQKEEISMT